MDLISKLTLGAYAVLLVLVLWTRIYRALPWLLVAVSLSIFEAVSLPLVMARFGQNSDPYYYAFYGAVALDVLVYAVAACTALRHRDEYIAVIGFWMALYDVYDLATTVALVLKPSTFSADIQTFLRWPNFATLLLYSALLMLHAGRSSSVKGGFHVRARS